MARSVTISTPIPSLEEVGKRLGLSKKRQESLLKIVYQRTENATSTGVRTQPRGAVKKQAAAGK